MEPHRTAARANRVFLGVAFSALFVAAWVLATHGGLLPPLPLTSDGETLPVAGVTTTLFRVATGLVIVALISLALQLRRDLKRLRAAVAKSASMIEALQDRTGDGLRVSLEDAVNGLSNEVAALRDNVAVEIASLRVGIERVRDGQATYLGDHEALTRLHNGQRIYVDTRDVSIASHLMLEGRWETWIEAVLREATGPDMCFVDAGANFGYYTLSACHWVGAGGRVEAFEANPRLFRMLRKSVSVNGFDGRARLHRVAVHRGEGAQELSFMHEYSGGGSLLGNGADPDWKPQHAMVRTTALDTALVDLPEAHVLKIDVEGAEAAVIQGAAGLIARSPSLVIVMEFNISAVASSEAPNAFLARFTRDGFCLRIAEPGGLTEPLTPEDCLDRLNHRLGYLHLSRR